MTSGMKFGMIACGIAASVRYTVAETQKDALSLIQKMLLAAPDIEYTIDLRGGALLPSPTPFISFVVPPEDSNNDTWFETVVKINVGDPALNNPYDAVEFEIKYDGVPTGMTVNIGDSITNNGFKGDGGTQSNDAEMQIGTHDKLPADDVVGRRDLTTWGKDGSPPGFLNYQFGLVCRESKLQLKVKDEYLQWDNGRGISGEYTSSHLYALNGQADSQGSVNYDIFGAFNRVIKTNSRIGSGVGKVTIRLRDLIQ